MRKTGRLLAIALALWGLSASGHLCNNIYKTPDRLIVKPEKQVAQIDQGDQFRVFVQNNYHTTVSNVRLTATVEGGGVDVTIKPDSVREMTAGQRVSYDVKLSVQAGAARGPRALKFGINTNQTGFRPVAEATAAELFEAAQNGNHSPAIMAAESLAKLKDQRGMAKLREWAQRDNPDYRGRAIRAIGKAGDREQIQFLRGLLAERNGWIRGNTLLALGLLKDDLATFRANTGDRDPFTAAAAYAGAMLAGEKSKELATLLRGGLQHEDVYVQIACAWALAATLRDMDAVAVLDKAFKPANPQQRTTAGDALVDIANRAAPEGKP